MRREIFRPSRFLAMVAVLFGAGCAGDPPAINPRFEELAPARIAVMPVENATLIDLTRVNTDGLLQSLFTKREVNVPEAVQRGLVEGLEKKGYVADWMGSAGGPDYRTAVQGPLPVFDGALYCRIIGWRNDPPSSGSGVSITCEVELVRVADAANGGGESLYQVSFSHRTASRKEAVRNTPDLEEEGRRTGLGAISTLPPARKRAAPAVADRPRRSPGPEAPPLKAPRP